MNDANKKTGYREPTEAERAAHQAKDNELMAAYPGAILVFKSNAPVASTASLHKEGCKAAKTSRHQQAHPVEPGDVADLLDLAWPVRVCKCLK